ncbi:MAG: hypothetical protein LYZ69_00040 [Nitrososphaerales archaeon]|nr:hypothetical protein [Nitrososphaerales archaeon]
MVGHFPDRRWSAICPKTQQKLDFDDYFYEGEAYHSPQVYVYSTMKFPKGSGDEVEVRCSKCKETHLFQRGELLAPVDIVEADQEELKNLAKLEEIADKREAREHEKEIKGYETRIKELERRVNEKDKLLSGKMNDLAEAYLTIAKFVNIEVPKLIAQAKSGKANYEATNP